MINTSQPPIFVVSLAKDTQRRAPLIRQLQKYDVHYEIIDAVDGRLLSDTYIDSVCSQKRATQILGISLAKAEIGCALSHLAIYQKMLKENIEQAVILEDDAIIDDLFATVIKDISPALPKDWQLLLLGYRDSYRLIPYKRWSTTALGAKLIHGFLIRRSLELTYSTHAYIINRRGAQKLLQQTVSIHKPIDHYTGDYKHINLYLLDPKCVDVNGADSLIGYERSILRKARHKKIKERGRENIYFKIKGIIKNKFIISCYYYFKPYRFKYIYRAMRYKIRYFLGIKTI